MRRLIPLLALALLAAGCATVTPRPWSGWLCPGLKPVRTPYDASLVAPLWDALLPVAGLPGPIARWTVSDGIPWDRGQGSGPRMLAVTCQRPGEAIVVLPLWALEALTAWWPDWQVRRAAIGFLLAHELAHVRLHNSWAAQTRTLAPVREREADLVGGYFYGRAAGLPPCGLIWRAREPAASPAERRHREAIGAACERGRAGLDLPLLAGR